MTRGSTANPLEEAASFAYLRSSNGSSDKMVRVTSTQFVRTPGAYQDQAQRKPVMIMKHNREHTVLLSAEEYYRLKRRDRQVFRVGELSEGDMAAVAAVEPPAEAASFDHELADEKI